MKSKANLILSGVALWAAAAALMHFIGPYLFNGGLPHIVFWISNFLAPISVIPLIAKWIGRTKQNMLEPITLILLPAMTLDGFAITFDTLGVTHIYASEPTLAGLTGGFLLFAFASFFFWALIWHKE